MSANASVEPRDMAVRKYFTSTPKKPQEPILVEPNKTLFYRSLVLLGISALIALSSSSLSGWGYLAFILSAVLTVWQGFKVFFDVRIEKMKKQREYRESLAKYNKAYQLAEPKPSDEQMDAWLQEDIKRLTDEALRELDLEPEQLQQDPIIVVGPSNTASLAIGKDGVVRYSKYDVLIVFLTEYHLAAYTATINMVTGTTLRESTQEYHYTDIVSVATRTESSKKFVLVFQGENKKLPVYKEFSLSVASGDHIRVVTPFDSPEFLELFESEGEVKIKIPETGADRAVRLIRARLREKKGGAHV